jgi:polar amino acid transport system substrate-binding protein
MIRSSLFRSLAHRGTRLSCFAQSALIACVAVAAIGALSAHAGNEKELLAPMGHLRVGIYPGSPTSMVVDPATNQTHGIAHDLGQEFGNRLEVPIEYVTFQRVADIVTAIKNGEVGFTVTNATAARVRPDAASRSR